MIINTIIKLFEKKNNANNYKRYSRTIVWNGRTLPINDLRNQLDWMNLFKRYLLSINLSIDQIKLANKNNTNNNTK